LGGLAGIDLIMNGNIVIQNMFCVFDIKKDDFYCIEKQEFRRRIKKYPHVLKKYRKSKKSIRDYIETLKEISTIDSSEIEVIIN
jgi:hypothetical protein